MKKARKLRNQKSNVLAEDKGNISKVKSILKLFAILLPGLLALLLAGHSKDVDSLERPEIIILGFADFLKELSDFEIKLSDIKRQDLINELITSQLQPVQKRYSNILQQTIVYEDLMKKSVRSLGSGPKHFVDSSTKELEELHESIIHVLDSPELESVKWITQLGENAADIKEWMNKLSRYGIQESFLDWQKETDISFSTPEDGAAPEDMDVEKMQMLLNALGNLQSEKYEKTKEIEWLAGITGSDPKSANELRLTKLELEEVQRELSAELELNRKYYRFTYHFLIEQYNLFLRTCSSIQEANKESTFLYFMDQLEADISVLKERVQRLLD